MLEVHPFLKSTGIVTVLPPQLLSRKEKERNKDEFGVSEWYKRCLNSLEFIARSQYNENIRKMTINDNLVNNEFNVQDFIDDEDEILNPLEQLVKEGKLPHFIRNYDIFSKPFNTLVQEFAELPDTFHVVGEGEKMLSERIEYQTQLLHDWFNEELENKFNSFLVEKGIDINQSFKTEEEQQQFQNKISELRKSKTPIEIAEYMKSDYRHIAEMWAEYELQDQKTRFRLDEKRREEFQDLLKHSKRVRHLRIHPYGLKIETPNIKNVFYQKNQSVKYIHRGDYGGLFYIATPSMIIDNFGKYLTAEQLQQFDLYKSSAWEDSPTHDFFGNTVNYTSVGGLPYDKWMPSFSPFLNSIAPNLGMNYTYDFLGQGVGANSAYINSRYFVVTEAYWKGFEIIYTLSWINPDTQLHEIVEVDESFVFPDYIKIIKNKTSVDEIELNTAVQSYRTIVHKGCLIRNINYTGGFAPIYVNCGELDYQRTSPYQVEVFLPIMGQVMNYKNTNPQSFIDKLKPYQFLVNVAMNKVAKLQERSFIPYVIHDLNLIPNQNGWEGTDALYKYILAGEETGALPVNTSPSNLQGGGVGGQYPRIIDIDLTPRIISQLEIARNLTLLAYDQIGMTPPRLGDVKGIDTATGLNTSVTKSYTATGSYFTEFWECERDMLQIQLDVAQWLESKNAEITKEFVKSDFTRGWLKFANNGFNLYDLRIYISNSQEELRLKKMYEQLAISNNTLITDLSTRMEMINYKTPTERILQVVKEAEEKAKQREDQINQFKQQELQAKTEQEKQKLEQEKELFYAKLQNDLKEAFIRSRGYISEGEQDLDKSGIPDAFEYEKFTTMANNQYEALGLQKDKMNLERQKEEQRVREKQAELNLKQKEMALKEKQIEQTAKNVKILDKGKYNKL